MKRAGSDPRPDCCGFVHPAHWDGRGLSPYFMWALLGCYLIAVAIIVLTA